MFSKKIYNLKNIKIVFDYQDPWSIEEIKKKNFIQKFIFKEYYKLEKYLLKNSDLIVTQGIEQTAMLVKRHDIEKEKFVFTWNTADEKIFKPDAKISKKMRKKYSLNNKILILYLGSIVNYFGIDLIPKAAIEVIKKFKNVHFVFLGLIRDEGYWNLIKEEINHFELNKYFTRIEPDSIQEIPQIIASCDIGLVTHKRGSIISELAIPTKLFEYLSSGLAVVSSDLSHITRFIIPEKSGLTFKSNNSKDLAKTLIKLIKNPSKIKHMGKNARESVKKKYNWNNEMEKLMDAYHKMYFTSQKNI